jgi:sarcosine oxidase
VNNTLYDWAVVGAGVFGSWIAHFLRQKGQRVLLVDAYGPGNSRASSGGESRLIRASYGTDEIYTRWAKQSLPHWIALSRRSTLPLFHQVGVMRWAGREDAHLAASVECLKRCAVPFELLEGTELAQRFPQICFDQGTRALLEPEAGALMARRSVETLVRELVAQGVDYRRELVQLPLSLPARSTVFACGPWLPKLFPDVVGKRIRPTRQEIFFFGSPSGKTLPTPGWIDSGDPRNPYGFPDLENRGVKIAFHDLGPAFDPDTGDRQISPDGVTTAREYLAKRFPSLHNAPLVESRVCQYENTSSADFLIDRHPRLENVWLVGGGSGHGFKHGPALGEYFANLTLSDAPCEPRFSLKSKLEEFTGTAI